MSVAAVLVLALTLALPPMRALAQEFLALFRVQQITVVSVDPANLNGMLGSSSQLEQVLSEDVAIEEVGQMEEVASAGEAGVLAGIPVRLPTAWEDQSSLYVQPGGHISLDVNLDRARALLAAINRTDIVLPDSLEGATITAEIPRAVMATQGGCRPSQLSEPDIEQGRLREGCALFVQLASPTVSAPPALPVAALGQAFLQVMGMSPEEAARFGETLDWSTTLVLPIPRYGTSYREVQVDGVTGTLITQEL
ncbi:MAG: hypothetical protein ACRDIB_10355, partial [Ardenticatenaceae bacterium]